LIELIYVSIAYKGTKKGFEMLKNVIFAFQWKSIEYFDDVKISTYLVKYDVKTGFSTPLKKNFDICNS
jgi:hypothetical protein